MKNIKKIKIHVKNNHWAPGNFPTDAEGEKNFTITKVDFEKALEKEPEIKDKIEVYIGRLKHLMNVSKITLLHSGQYRNLVEELKIQTSKVSKITATVPSLSRLN